MNVDKAKFRGPSGLRANHPSSIGVAVPGQSERNRMACPESDKDLAHLGEDAARRVRMTISCHDTDRLEKVTGAGEVFELNGTAVQRMHNGLLIEEGCYYGPWMTEIISALNGHHEPQEEVVFHEIVERLVASEPDATMFELGSFWAYYSMWFRQRTSPQNRIVDMEPDPAYLETGQRNFALNGMGSTFVHGVVGTTPGETTLFTTESTGETINVRQYDLASLMSETGVERIGLLMVDIQGFETPLIARASELLRAGKVRFMVVSTHHHLISGDALTHQQVLAQLIEDGAHVIAEHTVGESFSGDGLVAVSFDRRDEDFTVDVSHARYKESLFGELEPDLQRSFDELAIRRAETAGLVHELAMARAETAGHANDLAIAGAQAAEAKRALSDITQSHTWRFTRPLRALITCLRRN